MKPFACELDLAETDRTGRKRSVLYNIILSPLSVSMNNLKILG